MQTGLWFSTVHVLFCGHGDDRCGVPTHGFLHLPAEQAMFDSQSSSARHSFLSIAHVSSPFSFTTKPNLQTQTGLWLRTVHFLNSSHCTSDVEHGSSQIPPLEQDKLSGQSLWVWQGETVSGILGRGVAISSHFGSGLQCWSGRPVWQLGHEHLGRWSTVVQSAFSPQAPRNVHGSKHCMPMQAFSLGQSKSLKHSWSVGRSQDGFFYIGWEKGFNNKNFVFNSKICEESKNDILVFCRSGEWVCVVLSGGCIKK